MGRSLPTATRVTSDRLRYRLWPVEVVPVRRTITTNRRAARVGKRPVSSDRLSRAGTDRDLDLRVRFGAGEEIRTEISAKFTRPRLESDLAAAGLELADWLTGPDEQFAVCFLDAAVPSHPRRQTPRRAAGRSHPIRYRSSVSSPPGCEQQISALPGAGGSSGSGR